MGDNVKYLVILLILATLISTSNWVASGKFANPIGDMSDLSNLLPLQLMINDPGLFSRDTSLQLMAELYPPLFNIFMAKLILICGDFRIAHLIPSFIFFWIFIVGLYLLAYELTKNKRIGLIYALSFLFASVLWVSIGVSVGSVGTASLVRAFTPLLILYFVRNYKDFKKTLGLFFVIGLLANVHAYSAGFLMVILLLTKLALYRFSIKSISQGIFSLALFFIGAFFILFFWIKNTSWANFSLGKEEMLEMLTFKVNYFFPSIFHIGELVLALSPILFLAGIGFYIKKKEENDKFLLYFLLSTILLTVAGIITARFIPQLIPLSFHKALGYTWYVLLFYPAYLADYLLKKKENKSKALGLVVIFLLIFPTSQTIARIIHPWGRTIYYKSRGIDITQLDRITVSTKENWDAFYELADWAEKNTRKDALFMIPPRGLSHFRAYSKRSILISQKSFFAFAGTRSLEQYHLLQEITSLYQENSTPKFLEAAKKYDVDYMIVNKRKNELSLPLTFENEEYIVYTMEK